MEKRGGDQEGGCAVSLLLVQQTHAHTLLDTLLHSLLDSLLHLPTPSFPGFASLQALFDPTSEQQVSSASLASLSDGSFNIPGAITPSIPANPTASQQQQHQPHQNALAFSSAQHSAAALQFPPHASIASLGDMGLPALTNFAQEMPPADQH